MTFFVRSSSQLLNPPSAPLRQISQRLIRTNDNVDDILSSDLEISFASNVSLNSPPREQLSLPSDCEPMDISPALPINPPSRLSGLKPQSSRPRAFTSGARLFGNDISNSNNHPQIATGSTSAKRTQRAALPTEWLAAVSVSKPLAHEVCAAQTVMEHMLT
jgi:M-phase inducer tyrosine phosphatase